MYERFSDPARRAMRRAREEARELGHPYCGTEHMLLAIAREPEGIAFSVLASLGIDHARVLASVDEWVERGAVPLPKRFWFFRPEQPQTPTANQAIQNAMHEVQSRGSSYVGTEHLLLGLMCVENCIAAHALGAFGATYEGLSGQVAERHNRGESEVSRGKREDA